MDQRINIEKTKPEVWKALIQLAGIINRTQLSVIQKQLIKVRASQLNNCAYCLNMHTKEALKAGETQQRLFLLSAWKDTALFSDQEKALLQLTEEVTFIHRNGVSEDTYARALDFFDSETVGDIILTVVMINTWNRLAVSTHMPLD